MAYKFQSGLCNESYYGKCVRHLVVRCGEHIGISPLTNRRLQLRNDIAVCHHLSNCNYSNDEDFNVLCHKSRRYLLELKESLLIMRDRPSMNRNIHSASLYLFELVFVTLFNALCGLLWSILQLFYVTF